MADQDQPASTADIQRQALLRGRLGELMTWKVPSLFQSIGPFDPEAFKPFDDERRALIEACAAKLASYTDEQIASISAPVRDTKEWHDWSRFRSRDPELLWRRTPPWHLGGFGHPDFLANFDHWTRMTHFKVSELTCLTLGIEPRSFTWAKLVELSNSEDRPHFHHPLGFLVNRFDQLFRKFSFHSRDSHVLPLDFMEWADRYQVEIHPSFIGPLRAFNPRKAEATTSKALRQDQREIDTIAQLFTTVCIEEYGYRPNQARGPIPTQVADVANRLGLTITPETVRKYLRIGASFLPADFVPDQR